MTRPTRKPFDPELMEENARFARKVLRFFAGCFVGSVLLVFGICVFAPTEEPGSSTQRAAARPPAAAKSAKSVECDRQVARMEVLLKELDRATTTSETATLARQVAQHRDNVMAPACKAAEVEDHERIRSELLEKVRAEVELNALERQWLNDLEIAEGT